MKFHLHKHHSKEQAEIERLTAELQLYKRAFEHIYEKPIRESQHIYASIKNPPPHIYASIKNSIYEDILPTCQAANVSVSAQAQTPPPLPPPRHNALVSRHLKITSEV